MNQPKSNKDWTNQIDKIIFIFASVYLMIALGWLWTKKQQYTIANNNQTSTNIEQSTNQLPTPNNNGNTKLENQKPATKGVPTPIQPEKNQLPNKNNSKNQPQTPTQTTLIKSIPLPPIEEIKKQTVTQVSNNTPVRNNSPQVNNSNRSNNQDNLANNLISISSNQLPPPPNNNLPVNQQPQSIVPPPNPIVQPPKVNKIPTFGNNETQNNSSIPQINISNQNQSGSINSGDVAVNSNPNDLITNITSNNYSLVGVVQLPENASFALFKSNDITEKISVGTEIGTSGWVLMAVNGNQAIVSRENQSRNVRVGESF